MAVFAAEADTFIDCTMDFFISAAVEIGLSAPSTASLGPHERVMHGRSASSRLVQSRKVDSTIVHSIGLPGAGNFFRPRRPLPRFERGRLRTGRQYFFQEKKDGVKKKCGRGSRGCRAPFFRKLYAVCGCGNFCSRARLRASGKFFGSFFDLRSGILIFPHMYSTTKIFQQFEIFTERTNKT